jgi:hypothetical protein
MGFRLGGEVRLPIIAAPGGGKGTQGERLAAKFSVRRPLSALRSAVSSPPARSVTQLTVGD